MKLYHLTPSFLGNEVELRTNLSEERGSTEIEISRVCASPTIEECIYAIRKMTWFQEAKENNTLCLFVYKIANTENFVAYNDVFDFDKTNEHYSVTNEIAKLDYIVHIPNHKRASYLGETFEVLNTNLVYEKISLESYNEYYKN